MRELTSHRVSGADDQLTVTVLDERGHGNANHLYQISGFDTETNASDPFTVRHGSPARHASVLFQNGPIKEVGVNGITHETLLAILLDRLEGFQEGRYACEENATVLHLLRVAQNLLLSRTKSRILRGVEGTHAK